MTVGELRKMLNYIEDSVVVLIEDPNDFRKSYQVREALNETRLTHAVLLLAPDRGKGFFRHKVRHND